MNLIKVDNIPAPTEPKVRHDLSGLLDEFMNMNTKYVKVAYSDRDYIHVECIRHALWAACRRQARPVKVVRRGEDIYLMRTDM